jgi:threonylcarbamoyladenosine tRNA methylthiotransferase MtaB
LKQHVITTSKEAFIPSFSFGDRTRSFLKIQDGCDYYCSYCTIPLARGHSRSETIENTLKQINSLTRSGVREIILTGVNIGDFGKNNQETFLDLLLAIRKIEDLPRIRISSIEPDLLSDDIMDIIAGSEPFMPHFHIPLQSGSNTVLKAMKRKYDTGLFSSRVKKIRSVLPYACIASDIIAGFPGETEKDFLETLEYVEQLDISYLHVFTYSKRNNTLASQIGKEIQDKVKKVRSDQLHKLSEIKKRRFYNSNQFRDVQVLFESDNSGGWMHGFTENYIKVKTKYDLSLINQVISLTLGKPEEDMTFLYQ